jgi:hypothetical protein
VLRQSQYRAALAFTLVVLVGGVIFLFTRLPAPYSVMGKVTSCEESNQGQTLSPDRRYIATVFVRDCGTKVGYVTHVNLRKATDVFMADHGGLIATGEVVAVDGVALVTTKWANSTELEVRFQGMGPPQVIATGSWNGIAVHAAYERVAP